MLVAKCSSCKNKVQLQACEVCEEAKCLKCSQQHLEEYRTLLREKWKTIESQINHIQQQTNTKKDQLTRFHQSTEKQLSHLKQEYHNRLAILEKQYEEIKHHLVMFQRQCNTELEQLGKQWNELETNELFRQWVATTDSSRYWLSGDSSDIEKAITKIECCLKEEQKYDLAEYTFLPGEKVSLGTLIRRPHLNRTNSYADRQLYYTQLTNKPRHILPLLVNPRFIAVHQTSIFIGNSYGEIQLWEYIPPANPRAIKLFNLEMDRSLENFIICFVLTSNHIVTTEKMSDRIMVHSHTGVLKKIIPYLQPTHILSSLLNDDIWICSSAQKTCILFRINLDCDLKEMERIEYQQEQPTHLCRMQKIFLVHDCRSMNSNTQPTEDNLLIYNSLNPTKEPPMSISLEGIKHERDRDTTRLYHPIADDEGFLIIKHVPNGTKRELPEELVVIDITDLDHPVVVNRIELYSIFGTAFTADNELIIGINRLDKRGELYIF